MLDRFTSKGSMGSDSIDLDHATYTAAEDVLVKITGVVGTLDASDILLV